MRFTYNPATRQDHTRNTYIVMSGSGTFSTYSRGRALCEDGVVRAFYCTGYPDTLWTVPAMVTVKRQGKTKTISGFITLAGEEGGGTYVRFVGTGKNGALIKGEEKPVMTEFQKTQNYLSQGNMIECRECGTIYNAYDKKCYYCEEEKSAKKTSTEQ